MKRILLFLLPPLIGLAGYLMAEVGVERLVQQALWLYGKVGISLIALLPLAVWSLVTVFRQGKAHDLTLSYIAVTAQRFGLLGTVAGIIVATMQIGSTLSGDSSQAGAAALPAVGQALISTGVGFTIAIACDFFRYHDQKKHCETQGLTDE